MIAWGQKYGVDTINHIVGSVLEHASVPPDFVLITDGARPGLHPSVRQVMFDPWYLQPGFLSQSCQAKLVMFEDGVLEDVPSVFVDLDTAILGDLRQLIGLMRQPDDILMFQSVTLPFGLPGRLVHRLTGGRRYARGNSSVVVFRPGRCRDIARSFRAHFDGAGGACAGPAISDERFISWAAQDRIRALPRSVAVKFPNEYMHPLKSVLWARSVLPWVRARRKSVVAVTLPGTAIKPEALVLFREGMRMRDEKRRWLLWDRRVIGDIGERLQAYYRDVFPEV